MYSNELVCNILDYLDNNINTEISIDLISSIFCYDKFYIMKRFKKEIGTSIFNYINAIKVHNSLKFFKRAWQSQRIDNWNFNLTACIKFSHRC